MMKKYPPLLLSVISLFASHTDCLKADDEKDRDDREEIAVDDRFEFLDKNKDD